MRPADPDPNAAPSRRIGGQTSIDYGSTLDFFERHAERSGGEPRITVTSYQDHDPELAERRDQAEWERAEPLLGLDRRPVALDVGCGVGRWARHLAGRVERYLGIDFSPGLVELARRTLDEVDAGSTGRIQVRGAAEVGDGDLDDPGPFGLVIVSGVFTYLNDADVRRSVRGIAGLVADDAVVYVREPVGIHDRLTLSEHWSSELDDHYHAIYRVAEDYRSVLVDALAPLGFDVRHDAPLDPSLQNRSDTTQHFFVLARSAPVER